MTNKRHSVPVENQFRGEVSRRDLIKRAAAAGVAASVGAAALTHGASAAPGSVHRSTARHQADAKTLVILDNMSGGSWLYYDPAVIYEINPAAGFNLVYETLYHLPDNTKLTDFQPLLADGMPEYSADGLSATIKLRKGVKFHNSGNEMKAADWLFSWNRLVALQGNPAFLFTDTLKSVEAVDDHTLKLTLLAPNAALTAILAAIPMSVTDSVVLKTHGGVDANATPVVSGGALDPVTEWFNAGNSAGTGPHRVTGWDISSEVTLEVFADYWGEKSKLDRVIFRNVADPNTQLQLIQTGEADLAFALDPDSAAKIKADPTLQILESQSLAYEYLALQTDPTVGGPMANKQVRQAIAHAVDYDGIITNLTGGAAVRPATVVPLGLLGANEIKDLAFKTDLAMAQKLFDASGVGPVELTLTWGSGALTPAGLGRDTLAPKLKQDLEKIKGLTIKLTPMDPAQRLADYRNGKLQFTMSDWSPDFPDVHSYAQPFGHKGGAAAKRVHYANPEVDALIDQGIKELDATKRKQLYIDAQKLILDDVPFIVEFQPNYRCPASMKVQGVQPHGVYILQLRFASKTA
ncbi:MAG: ABC transporter substrate-binding protein [Thermomicrobiales bacterium]